MQDVRGRNICLVEVTTTTGERTGDLMFVSFCANCNLGLPVQMFDGVNSQCNRCVECKKVDRAESTGERVDRPVGPDDQWIDAAHALPLKPVAQCKAGRCQAEHCTNQAQRAGDLHAYSGDLKKLCYVHAPVRRPSSWVWDSASPDKHSHV